MLSIKQRQQNLKTFMCFYNGKIDGIEGNGTRNAYKSFQKYVGISVDGIYGKDTESHLVNIIKRIQSKVNVSQDGLVGNITINAIKNYQKNYGLYVDGIVGVKTYNKMFNVEKYKCKYFKDSEFTCKCGCGTNLQKNGIMKIADQVREHFNRPTIVTSGTRCIKHNKEVGGVAGSYHTTGNAIDIIVTGVNSKDVLTYCKTIVSSGKARYTYGGTTQMGSAVHIDTGGLE